MLAFAPFRGFIWGMSDKDLKVSFGSYNDSVSQMQDGHAQIFTLGAAAPVSAVLDLASNRDIRAKRDFLGC